MTIHEVPERSGPPSARDMRDVSAREISDALANILHEKTSNRYVVHVDQISFTKDPNAYDGGSLSVRFERNTSAERESPEEIVEAFFREE
jgi:hypothetical protein